MEQLGSHCMGFCEIWNLSIFQKCVKKFSFHWNWTRIMGTLPETNIHFWSYLTQFSLQWENFFKETWRENQKTCFITNNFLFLFLLNHAVYGIMWKILYSQTGYRWQYGAWTWRAGYLRQPTLTHTCTHACTHSEYVVTYCFSTTRMVAQMHLNVTLHVHCLSCYKKLYSN